MIYEQESDQEGIIAWWEVGRDLCCPLIIKDFEPEVIISNTGNRNLGSKYVPSSADQFKQMLVVKPSWSY